MKRKILSLLLALCLVVGMVPLAASATDEGVLTITESVADANNNQKFNNAFFAEGKNVVVAPNDEESSLIVTVDGVGYTFSQNSSTYMTDTSDGLTIFAGYNNSNDSKADGCTITVKSGAKVGAIFAGGYNNSTTGNVTITVEEGAEVGTIYGGGLTSYDNDGDYATAKTDSSEITVNGTCRFIYAGGRAAVGPKFDAVIDIEKTEGNNYVGSSSVTINGSVNMYFGGSYSYGYVGNVDCTVNGCLGIDSEGNTNGNYSAVSGTNGYRGNATMIVNEDGKVGNLFTSMRGYLEDTTLQNAGVIQSLILEPCGPDVSCAGNTYVYNTGKVNTCYYDIEMDEGESKKPATNQGAEDITFSPKQIIISSSNEFKIDNKLATGQFTESKDTVTIAEDKILSLTNNVVIEGNGEDSSPVATIVAQNQTTQEYYTSLQTAIDEANEKDTIILLNDFTLNAPADTPSTNGALTINSKEITIDGNNKTITTGTGFKLNESKSRGEIHVINILGGANVTIQNLTIKGSYTGPESLLSEDASIPRSGINVYTSSGDTSLTTVKLNNVTVTNCSTYGVTSNGSNVTATNLNTSGNNWGGVNVDNMNGAALGGSLTIESGTIQSVVIENTSKANKGQNVGIEGGTFTGEVKLQANDAPVSSLSGVSLVISGGTFSNQATRDYLEKNGFLAEGMEFDSNGKVVEEQPSTPVTPSTPTYANTVSDTENGKVTASPTRPKEGATVTITTTPDKGYEVGSVSVTDADGKAVAVTNAGNGKYTFKQPDSKVTIKVTFVWDNPFTDVGNAWYRNAIQYVYENNLMAGTGDTTFDPEVSLTRAMTAQILYNLEGKPKVDEEATFADMNEAPTWSVDAIAWAQDTGVVAGMGDNEFAPNAKVTREQFAQMMYNYAKYKKYDLTKTGDLSKFPDDGSVSDWAETAMSWANGNGLINGHEDSGLIDPAGNTIRGQAASIIMNFDKNVVK